jgi:hypothetical protein
MKHFDMSNYRIDVTEHMAISNNYVPNYMSLQRQECFADRLERIADSRPDLGIKFLETYIEKNLKPQNFGERLCTPFDHERTAKRIIASEILHKRKKTLDFVVRSI